MQEFVPDLQKSTARASIYYADQRHPRPVPRSKPARWNCSLETFSIVEFDLKKSSVMIRPVFSKVE